MAYPLCGCSRRRRGKRTEIGHHWQWWLGLRSAGKFVNPYHCVAAYQAKGVDSYADSLVNLANPGTFNLSEDIEDYDGLVPYSNPPTWDTVNGWSFDRGDGSYTFQALNTGITGYDIGKGTGSILVFYSDFSPILGENQNVVGASVAAGSSTNPSGYTGAYIQLGTVGARYYASNGAYQASYVTDLLTSGAGGVTGQTGYYNGVVADFANYWPNQTPPWCPDLIQDTPPIYLGACSVSAFDAAGNVTYPQWAEEAATCKIQAIAFYNTTLSEKQLDAIVDAADAQGAM